MVKKRTRRLSFMVAALMLLSLFAALPGIALAATVTPAPVTGVTSPVGGAVPSTAISDGDGFTAALSWNGSPAAFAYETAYTATVTLTAAETYDFAGLDDTESIAEFTVNSKAPVWVSNENGVLTFTVTFDATGSAPAPNITGVTAGTDTIAAAGGNSVITVAGTNLPDDITVKAFLDDGATADESVTAGAVGGSATSRTVTLTFPENESAADEVYTVKVSLDGGTNWAPGTDTVTVSAPVPAAPAITDVKAAPEELTAAGGGSTITVGGTNLVNGMKVTAFDGAAATAITGTASGNAVSQVAILTFPANTAASDKVYTVKASLDGGTTWSNFTGEVTVKGTAAAEPELVTPAPITGINSPVTGMVPDLSGDETPEYAVLVSWENIQEGTFLPETGYSALVRLIAKPGYTFSGGLTTLEQIAGFTVNGLAPARPVSNQGTQLSFYIQFPVTGKIPEPTIIIPEQITGVTSPVAGALPSRTVNNGTGFTAKITGWYVEDRAAFVGRVIDETKPFELGKEYGIEVELTAEPGYTFWEASKGSVSNSIGDAALRAEAQRIVESFTINGVKASRMDISTWFLFGPNKVWFQLIFPVTPAAPTISGNEGSTQIDYTQSGSGVGLNISGTKTDELIAGAKAADNVVDINLSALSGVDAAAIPADALGAVADENLSLSLRFPKGTVSVSAAALGSFTGAAAAGTTVLTVILRDAPASALTAAQTAAVAGGESVYQIAVQDNAGEMHSFTGSFTITVPYGEQTPNAAWYLKDDGTKEAVSFSLNNIAKTVTVTLPHLSLYGLSYEAVSATPAPTANQNGVPVTGDGNSAALWMLLTLVSLGSFAGLFVWQKKKSTDR